MALSPERRAKLIELLAEQDYEVNWSDREWLIETLMAELETKTDEELEGMASETSLEETDDKA